jgi:hypothetical protein
MSFQEIGGARNYHKYSTMADNTVIVTGWYTRKDKNHYGCFYEVMTEDGELHVLNSAAILNKRMEENVALEDFIRVTYLGKVILTKGPMTGKPCANFKVEIDRSKSGKRLGANIAPEAIPAPTDAEKPSDSLEDLL